ncbi:HlyD family type I secretion periplasmic adaptor subunit [Azovibrio restrictus]|uniref:HlyD family type I secretion periplasmic adaptor subunit n=1 Tax=Azovibrio restrictus TaxID=146938 RepID=UPI0004122F10|nr:HlyD family type I secretion periplasmic adaptor subunit [Azovibrio restrictus]
MMALVNFFKAVLGRLQRLADPLLERLLGRLPREEEVGLVDFSRDGEAAILQQEPLRARILIRLIAWAIGIFLVWAALAQVDEVTRGSGKVIPSRQVQIIQSVDGGIVSEILVKEGDLVQQDQLLMQIDQTRFVSSVRESRAQYLSLQARAARLRALADGLPFVPPEDVLKEDPETVHQEEQLYEARRSELEAGIAIARQQLAQRQQELAEVRAKRDQAAQGYELTSKELAVTRPLIQSGAVSEVELLRLERDVVRYRGERDMAGAQIARIQASISEAQRKIEERELTFRNEAGKELSETMGKLNALSETEVGLSDRVKHSAIRSPVKGAVKRLLVNTVGGVVQPGKEVVEIVPVEDALLLEARVQPKDIAFLRPGQHALVRFTAYDFAVYGGLEGTLEHIGADTVTDDEGNAFYVVRVRTTRPDFGNANLAIMPGMVADVDIMTGKKSVLSYLLKPILRAKAYALSER